MATKIYWLIAKDLTAECRLPRAWPAMLLLGAIVAMLFSVQMDLPPEQQPKVASGMLWLAVFFAATLALDRSFAVEREEGCWEGLLLCPISPTTVYLAKVAVNFVAVAALQGALIPLFAVLTGVPFLARPAPIILAALLGNLGILGGRHTRGRWPRACGSGPTSRCCCCQW